MAMQSTHKSESKSGGGGHGASALQCHAILASLGWVIALVGLLLYLPLLFGVAMSFDSPGSGKHWTHWVFVVSNAMLGPLCLVSLLSRNRRHWGVLGCAIAGLGWAVITLICRGRFDCSSL